MRRTLLSRGKPCILAMAHSASFLWINLTKPQFLCSGHLACASVRALSGCTHIFNRTERQEERLKQVWRDSTYKTANEDGRVTWLRVYLRVRQWRETPLLAGLAATFVQGDGEMTVVGVARVHLLKPIDLVRRHRLGGVDTIEILEPRGARFRLHGRVPGEGLVVEGSGAERRHRGRTRGGKHVWPSDRIWGVG